MFVCWKVDDKEWFSVRFYEFMDHLIMFTDHYFHTKLENKPIFVDAINHHA